LGSRRILCVAKPAPSGPRPRMAPRPAPRFGRFGPKIGGLRRVPHVPGEPPRGAFWAIPGKIPGIMRHGLGTVFRMRPAPGAHPGPGAAAGEPPNPPFSRGHMPKFAEKTLSSRRFWPPATVKNGVPAAQKGLPAPPTLRRGRDGAGAVFNLFNSRKQQGARGCGPAMAKVRRICDRMGMTPRIWHATGAESPHGAPA
jgi:hypothetical protein